MSGTATGDRERQVIRAFVELSYELVDDYDVLEMLSRLTDACAALLDVGSAGLLLADADGVLHLAASSSERAHHLEAFQLQRDEGPCLDCFETGEPVQAEDPAAMSRRWPEFARGAELAGFSSVHALPMRLRDHMLGAIGLFGEGTGRLEEDDVVLAQALVHVACLAIVNEQAVADRALINQQLQRALTSRIVLEQAKGVVASRGDLGMDMAFTVLRRYARDGGRKLSEVAEAIVGRELAPELVLAHAREAGVTR